MRRLTKRSIEAIPTPDSGRIGRENGHYVANRWRSLMHRFYEIAASDFDFPGANPVHRVKPFVEQERERFVTPEELASGDWVECKPVRLPPNLRSINGIDLPADLDETLSDYALDAALMLQPSEMDALGAAQQFPPEFTNIDYAEWQLQHFGENAEARALEKARTGAAKASAAKSKKAAPRREAIRAGYLELKKTKSKKINRLTTLEAEFKVSSRHLQRIVKGLD